MIMSSSNNNNPPPITSPPTGGQQKQNDSSGSEGGGGVKVYKLVNDSGELQLLNEDEYDVVSVNSNTADNDYDGDDGMKKEDADDVMDVDESKEEKSDDENNETTLFIVRPTNYTHQHNCPSNNNHHGQQTVGE